MELSKVVIIGGGKVGRIWADWLLNSPYQLIQVYNRTLAQIDDLKIHTAITDDLNHLKKDADLYLIAISDNALEVVCNQLNFGSKLVAHTSGNKSIDVLRTCSSNYGLLYPFQSFSPTIPLNFEQVPLIVDGNNEDTINQLSRFAQTVSHKVMHLDESKRKWVNLSGVFANNFVNSIYVEMYKLLISKGIEPNILLPLINYTSKKLDFDAPYNLQTGPALRNDTTTIQNQLEMLSENPELSEMYQFFTQLIRDQHSE